MRVQSSALSWIRLTFKSWDSAPRRTERTVNSLTPFVQLRKAASQRNTPAALPETNHTEKEADETAKPTSGTATSTPTASSAAALAFQENPTFVELPEDACAQPAATRSGKSGEPNAAAELPAMNGTDRSQRSRSASARRQEIGTDSDAASPTKDLKHPAGNAQPQGSPAHSPHPTETAPGVVEGLHAEEGEVDPVQAAMGAIRKRADLMGVLLEDCNRMTEPDAVVHISVHRPSHPPTRNAPLPSPLHYHVNPSNFVFTSLISAAPL